MHAMVHLFNDVAYTRAIASIRMLGYWFTVATPLKYDPLFKDRLLPLSLILIVFAAQCCIMLFTVLHIMDLHGSDTP